MQKKVVVTTQPADQAREMLRLLSQQGFQAYNLPMIKTQTRKISDDQINAVTQPGQYQLLVFTSKKGVRGLFENLMQRKASYALAPGLKTAVVGPGTHSELKNYGLEADYINPGKTAEDLAAFLQEKAIQPGHKVLLALGNNAPDFLQENLGPKASVQRINVYKTIPLPVTDVKTERLIREQKADLCIFTSPSGFHNFLHIFGQTNKLKLAAIGSTTADAIREAGYDPTVIANSPSAQSLVQAINDYFAKQNSKT